CPVFTSRPHGFEDKFRRGVAQAGEDSARVEPARAELAKDKIPLKIARLELAGRRVAPVRDADGATHAETAFGKIQPVAHGAADTIMRNPFDELGTHSAL